jgi:acyl dehydratase
MGTSGTLPAALRERDMVVDRQAIRAYAEITGDFNPIHIDPEFAARTPMGGIIAHGMLSLNLVWQAVRETLGPEAAVGAALEIRFMKPVRENDAITAGGALEPAGGGYAIWVKNQKGETVIGGRLEIAPGAGAA